MRIRPPEKSLYFSPLSSAPSSPRPSKVVHFLSYLHLSAPSSPHLISFRVRLRALTSFLFECAFKPSTIKGSAFSILPPFKCALEPSFPFEHASEPSFPSSFHLLNSAPSSPIMSLLKNPRIFPLGR